MLLFKVYGWVSPFFRKRRMARFTRRFQMGPETRLLDVGGYPYTWTEVDVQARVTLLNLHILPDAAQYQDRYEFVVGDGMDLKYGDGAYDILYSNSVIEHLSNFENQEKFAREIRRVGRHLWIQTPARSFFIEPHLLTPFIHYLPIRWRKRLARRLTLWGWLTRPTSDQAAAFIDEIRLLSFGEMQRLFPDCEILKERFFGLTKSYIAIREWSDSNP